MIKIQLCQSRPFNHNFKQLFLLTILDKFSKSDSIGQNSQLLFLPEMTSMKVLVFLVLIALVFGETCFSNSVSVQNKLLTCGSPTKKANCVSFVIRNNAIHLFNMCGECKNVVIRWLNPIEHRTYKVPSLREVSTGVRLRSGNILNEMECK
jgi:hypothetical protein